jgi:hypothetical protein
MPISIFLCPAQRDVLLNLGCMASADTFAGTGLSGKHRGVDVGVPCRDCLKCQASWLLPKAWGATYMHCSRRKTATSDVPVRQLVVLLAEREAGNFTAISGALKMLSFSS